MSLANNLIKHKYKVHLTSVSEHEKGDELLSSGITKVGLSPSTYISRPIRTLNWIICC